MAENYGVNDEKILVNMEKEFNIPAGFLTEIIDLEKEYLFQLRRGGILKNIEKLIVKYAEE